MTGPLEHPVVVISIDAELIWGHFDLMTEERYSKVFPSAPSAYERLLARLCAAGISATWAVVGGLCLDCSRGPIAARLAGLPEDRVRLVPDGSESTCPLWYQPTFMHRLRDAEFAQDIGLHGGLTHLIWTESPSGIETIRADLLGGLKALGELFVRPVSFVFPRHQEAHHELLRAQGFLCYRGCAPMLSETLPRGIRKSIVRAVEELGRITPRPVWPQQKLPGLWNIPASLSLYPLGRLRTCAVPVRTRIDRFRRGVQAAVRSGAIFHFWLHPETLAESSGGFQVLDAMLEHLIRARESGDVETLNMAEVAQRMAGQADRSSQSPSDIGERVSLSDS